MNDKRNTNHVTVRQFREMSETEENEIPLDQMHDLQQEIEEMKKDAAALAIRHTNVLLRQYEVLCRGVMQNKGKNTGIVTANFTSTKFRIQYEIPKKVEWDQAELRRIADEIANEGENPEEYLTITLSVPESRFNAWPEKLKDRFVVARTVKDGPPRIKVLEGKNKDD